MALRFATKRLTWRSAAVMFFVAAIFFILLYMPATGQAVILPGGAVDIKSLVETDVASPNTGSLYVIPVRVLERRYVPKDVSPLNANPMMVFIGSVYPGALVNQLATYEDPSLDRSSSREAVRRGTLHTQTVPAEVALGLLNRSFNTSSTGARVLGVDTRGPSHRRLRVGDVVLRIDGAPIFGTADMVRALYGLGNETVSITVRRAGRERIVPVSLVDGRLGIAVEPADPLLIYDGGWVRVSDLRGTSGDLGVALEVYARASGEDLTRGRLVAAVGTVTPSGRVLGVGAVGLKLDAAERAGVSLMLVPREDAEGVESSTVRIVGVDSVAEAVAALQ